MASALGPLPLLSQKVSLLHFYLTFLPEGPWSVVVAKVDGQRITSMEYEAKVKGQEWVNHAYEVREVLRKITFSNKHCPNSSTTVNPLPPFKGRVFL